MEYKSRQRGETGLPMQTYCVGGEKTIGDPPTDPSPKDGHRVQDGRGGSIPQIRTGEWEPRASVLEIDKGGEGGRYPGGRGGG